VATIILEIHGWQGAPRFSTGVFNLREFLWQYVTRVISTYLIALAVVAVLLTLIGQCPWGVENALALKRIIVVAFPASMSATVTDALK
jgi:peptidoglycan/LPS O-acetylase OafA/YrhL